MNFIKITKQTALVLGVGLSLFLTSSYGDELLQVRKRTTEVEVGAQANLLVSLRIVDGNIEVVGEERDTVSVTIDDYDSNREDSNQAVIDYDAEAGTLKFRLRKDLRESDVYLRVPMSVSLRLKTVDGEIEVTGVRGEIDVSATDGNIVLEDVAGGVVAYSVDGNLTVSLARVPLASPMSLATDDGDILFFIPEGLNAAVRISTIDGDFECDVPLSLGSNADGDRAVYRSSDDGVNLEGFIGKGGPLVSLKTIDGNIELKKLP